MDVEHSVKVFPLDENLETNIRTMTTEGWLLMPGVTPVAVYHCVRMKGVTMPSNDAKVSINIDETKVQILRNGQLIDG